MQKAEHGVPYQYQGSTVHCARAVVTSTLCIAAKGRTNGILFMRPCKYSLRSSASGTVPRLHINLTFVQHLVTRLVWRKCQLHETLSLEFSNRPREDISTPTIHEVVSSDRRVLLHPVHPRALGTLCRPYSRSRHPRPESTSPQHGATNHPLCVQISYLSTA
jgi:hypothetical protein